MMVGIPPTLPNQELTKDFTERRQTMFNDMVKRALDDKVNELFISFQNAMGIQYGDVEPMDFIELEEMQNKLAVIIAKTLAKQAKQNGRVFYNFEDDTFITEAELRKDYNEMIEDGTLDLETYSDFGYYLEACMDYNNGSLEEIR